MRFFGRRPALAALCALVLAGLGCRGEPAGESGVAARVNGEPIGVAALEARHDLSRLGVPVADNPAVETLRAQYGAVLADMIVARLVGQELARQHLSVTPAEQEAAEAAVRADYPGDAFARMLVEERIDLDRWREIQRDRLALAKFARDVLGPDIRVGVTEAADYYKEHLDAFTTPARVRLLLVRGGEAEAVRTAQAAYRKAPSSDILAARSGVGSRELTLAERDLPGTWRPALAELRPGEAGPVLAEAGGSFFFVLLERQPRTVLEPATAYARVEAVLTARKREAALADWLAEALPRARIEVNRLLLPQPDPETPPAGPPPAPALASTAAGAVAAEPAEPVADGTAEPESGPMPAPLAGAAPQAPMPVVEATPAEPVEPQGAARPQAETEPAPGASPVVAIAAEDVVAAPRTPPLSPPPVREPPQPESQGERVAEFTAVKASWLLYATDDAPEERVYLKPGKPLRLAFARRLSVRLGSPSEVSYRFESREETVAVGKKGSRVLEFP